MNNPTFADYVEIICTLFDQFEQHRRSQQGAKMGKPYSYSEKLMIVFFVVMQFRRIFKFKTQRRWLGEHPEMVKALGFSSLPDRTTLSRRYKSLYETLQPFIEFLAPFASELAELFSQAHLVEDKSLFKALGPVWHQSDRQAGRIPAKLRHLDTDASWGKSGYQGWVYGYGLHLSCTQAAFPQFIEVATGSVSEKEVFATKEPRLLKLSRLRTLAADNSYTQVSRIRHWAKQGVALLTPAKKWVKGRFAQAYHRFLQTPTIATLLRHRRTTIEPLFDLIAKVIGTTGKHKQLPVQRLDNVRTCLALATFSVQIAMIINNIWGLPLRNISHISVVLA